VEKNNKLQLLKKIIKETKISSALVFTRTKYTAKKLALKLEKVGCRAVALQGNMAQSKRQEAMTGFRNGQYQILVATDIAARGIDVSGISHVINYDVPDTVEAYTHRIGRTGRADRTGEAITFATSEDSRIIKLIEQTLDEKMTQLNSAVFAKEPASREPKWAPGPGHAN
jgi:ATP-dependent RNA helicase RhlE